MTLTVHRQEVHYIPSQRARVEGLQWARWTEYPTKNDADY